MKNCSFIAGILIILSILSCDDTGISCADGPIVLNDTLVAENIYSLDIDSNGEIDVDFISEWYGGPGGMSCSINLKILKEELFVESKTKLIPICQDTLYLGPDLEYYRNINCNDEDNSIRTDTITVANLIQDEDIENIEILQSPLTEVLLYGFNGVGANGIYPGAIFNDITVSSFEELNPSGWLIFENDNNELYGLKLFLELNGSCSPISFIEVRRIDCK